MKRECIMNFRRMNVRIMDGRQRVTGIFVNRMVSCTITSSNDPFWYKLYLSVRI